MVCLHNINCPEAKTQYLIVMNSQKPTLLSIVEFGIAPDLTALYLECGYHVETQGSMRHALRFMKHHKPGVIVCEFNYLPTYSVRISNLEPMLAALERYRCDPALLIQTPDEQRRQLSRLDLSRWRHGVVKPTGQEGEIKRLLNEWLTPAPPHHT